jgi:hypothetical protein
MRQKTEGGATVNQITDLRNLISEVQEGGPG